MYTKVIQSGDLIEVYEFEKAPRVFEKRIRKARRSARRYNWRYSSNCARARKAFVRLVRANCGSEVLPALVTLTMAKIYRIDVAYREFTAFIERLRRVYGRGFRYIAVPEFQKRGAVHFHALIWSTKSIGRHERHDRVLQNLWGHGFVDCIATDGRPQLAAYLAKYMSKSLQDERLAGQKAFCASRNIMRSVSLPYASVLSYSEHVFGVDLSTVPPVHSRVFDTKYLGRAIYQRYDFSYDNRASRQAHGVQRGNDETR
jgi:hypothetical protein